MGVLYSPKIVTDGLVLYLDAANQKSYPGTGTVWNDLSGNGNNGTLINGPTFDSGNNGSIVFDGMDDRVNISNIGLYPTCSWECIINRTSQPTFNNESFLYASSNIDRISVDMLRRIGWRIRDNLGNFLEISTPVDSIELNTPFIITGTYDGTAAKIYINSQLKVTRNNITFFRNFGSNITVGLNLSNNQYFEGNIYSTKIYNRALLSEEILQNYNATKGRYGL